MFTTYWLVSIEVINKSLKRLYVFTFVTYGYPRMYFGLRFLVDCLGLWVSTSSEIMTKMVGEGVICTALYLHQSGYMRSGNMRRVFSGARNRESYMGEGPRYGCMSESVSDLCGEAMSINKVLKQAIMPINAYGFCMVFKSIPTFLCRSVFGRTEAIFDRWSLKYWSFVRLRKGSTNSMEGCPC